MAGEAFADFFRDKVQNEGLEPHQALRIAKRLDIVAAFRAALASYRLGLSPLGSVEHVRVKLGLSADDAERISRELDNEAALIGGLGPTEGVS